MKYSHGNCLLIHDMDSNTSLVTINHQLQLDQTGALLD